MLNQDASRAWNDLRLLLPLIVTNALHLLAAIGILIAGFWIAGRTQRLVRNSLGRTRHMDDMLQVFFGNTLRYFILTITVLAVLSQFGIQTTSLVAVLGAAGLAVGLALQGTLSHLAAGVMLLTFRPFRIGHRVLVGVDLGAARERLLAMLRGMPHALKEPAASVNFDRNGTDNALELVVTFAPEGGAGESAAVKSEIVQAVHDAFDTAAAAPSA